MRLGVLLYLPIVGALSFLAFSCGSSDKPGVASATAGASLGLATAEAPGAGAVGDESALANSILLTVQDFPSGWAEEPDRSDDPGVLDRCTPASSPGRTAKVKTGTFSKGRGIQISEQVTTFDTAAHLADALARVNEGADCAIKLLNDGKVDTDEAAYSDASFSPLSFSKKGDESKAFRLKVHVKAKHESGLGSEGDAYLDIVYIAVGRVGLSLQASDVLSPADPSEWEKYIDAAVARAQQAQ